MNLFDQICHNLICICQSDITLDIKYKNFLFSLHSFLYTAISEPKKLWGSKFSMWVSNINWCNWWCWYQLNYCLHQHKDLWTLRSSWQRITTLSGNVWSSTVSLGYDVIHMEIFLIYYLGRIFDQLMLTLFFWKSKASFEYVRPLRGKAR